VTEMIIYDLPGTPFQLTFGYNTRYNKNSGRLGEFIVYIALVTSYLFFGARNFHSRAKNRRQKMESFYGAGLWS